MNFIHRVGDARGGEQLGGKAAALAALRGCGVLIPDWFVVLPHALEAAHSETSRDGFKQAQPEENGGNLAGIQLAPEVLEELRAALAELSPSGELVAVRSSALEEDSPDHSFAGQLESFLSVHPDDVAAKVVAVWRSGFGAPARAYRERHRLPQASRPPAVLIQRMIHAEAAGVAFGADPVSGRPDVAVVSAVRGLGTALVNGESNADTWHVDATGKIVQRQIAHETAVLNDSEIRAAAELVRQTGRAFGRPQDIEWAIAQDALYLLQSRAITTLPNGGKLDIWDNSNIIESYSGVTTPLTFSFAQRAYEGVYRQFCRMLAVPRSKISANDQTFRHMLGLIRGRVYYNLLNWYRVLALLPGFTLNRRFMEQMMGVKEELPAEILAELGVAGVGARLRDGFDVGGSVLALVTNHFLLPQKVRRFQARLNEALTLPEKPLEGMTAHELAAYFLDLERKLLTRWDAPLLNDFFAMIFYGVLRRLTSRWAHDPAEQLQNALLCGEGGMISAEPAQRIRALALLATNDACFVKLLCEGQLPEILAHLPEVPKFQSAYFEYLAKFGDRCLGELKLESLTLHEDPMLLLRSVGKLAGFSFREPASPGPEAGTGERRSAEVRVGQALVGHPVRRLLFGWVLRNARARVRDRENLRFERTRLFGHVRRIFVELGRRLQAEGHLQEARDIFYLEIDELLGYLARRSTAMELKSRVLLRQTEFAEYRTGEPPLNRFTTRGITIHGRPAAAVESARPASQQDQRNGIGCSPGIVRGRVRKIDDPRNAVNGGREILVTGHTDPGWVLLFPTAAGLLVERGSLLSHSAIVAREIGMPAIVAIDGLTTWLKDGDEVEFDGSTGMVWRLAEAAPGVPPFPGSLLHPMEKREKEISLNRERPVHLSVMP